jgi:hypothetical protein
VRIDRKLLALVAATMLTLAACSPGEDLAEKIIESQEGVGDVEIDSDSGEVSVETDEGSLTLGGGEIPADFPIPLPEGGDVVAVIEAAGNTTISLEYDGSIDSIVGYYQDWVDSSGLEVQAKFETSDPETISWSLADGDEYRTITVSEEGDVVTVLVTALSP